MPRRRDTSRSHQDAISVQGGAGGAFGNYNFLLARIIRLEKSLALTVHADDARDKVGLARLNVAAGLVADDLAAFLQGPQHLLQGLLLVRAEAQSLQQLGNVGRGVIFPRQVRRRRACWYGVRARPGRGVMSCQILLSKGGQLLAAFHQVIQVGAEAGFHFVARHDGVDQSVFEQELGRF